MVLLNEKGKNILLENLETIMKYSRYKNNYGM